MGILHLIRQHNPRNLRGGGTQDKQGKTNAGCINEQVWTTVAQSLWRLWETVQNNTLELSYLGAKEPGI